MLKSLLLLLLIVSCAKPLGEMSQDAQANSFKLRITKTGSNRYVITQEECCAGNGDFLDAAIKTCEDRKSYYRILQTVNRNGALNLLELTCGD